MTDCGEQDREENVAESHSSKKFQGISNPLANLIHQGKPHGDLYAHHQMRLLCRINRKAEQGDIDPVAAFATLKETILALCEGRISQHFLHRNILLVDDAIHHVRSGISGTPHDQDLKKLFRVANRKALEDILVAFELYIADELDERDMVAELVMLADE